MQLGLGALILTLLCSFNFSKKFAETERNNWAVMVDTSRYWYNYRHNANTLTFYHTIKRLGIPDSQIILMLGEDAACNPRNPKPGRIFNEMYHRRNLYGEDVEVDYRGDEVSVENFIRLLVGRHPPSTPRNKRLLTDSTSNIFFFITGHSGDEFIKFQDWEEITSTDIADAFEQMYKQKRYGNIFWMSDTCQAATLQNQFYTPNIIAMGSSGKKENSYSHHIDHDIGIAIIDRFTYYSLDFFDSLNVTSKRTLRDFIKHFRPALLHSNPEMRSDLFPKKPEHTLMTEFFASTGKMRFQNSSLQIFKTAGESSACVADTVGKDVSYFGSDIRFTDPSMANDLLPGGTAVVEDLGPELLGFPLRPPRAESFARVADAIGSSKISVLGPVPLMYVKGLSDPLFLGASAVFVVLTLLAGQIL